jgi:hypothetical protein
MRAADILHYVKRSPIAGVVKEISNYEEILCHVTLSKSLGILRSLTLTHTVPVSFGRMT